MRFDVYTNRSIDGDVISEHKNKANALKAAKKEKDTAYIEGENLDNDECYYSEVIWSKDFFDVISKKYTHDDFLENLGSLIDELSLDSSFDYGECDSLNFLCDLYDIAEKLKVEQ